MAGNRVISAVLTLRDRDFSSTARRSAEEMREFERRTRHSSNTVQDFGRSATSGFKSVLGGAASLAGAVGIIKGVSGAMNLVKSSVSSAFDRIDTMESFERTMTTLTGSSEKANAALEATRDAVTGTGYGLDTAAHSVQNFVTRGMDIDKATDVVKQWGDAVAFYGDGSNEQFSTVTDAIGKMYSSGKVSMDQMNRIVDSGINPIEIYSSAVGMNVNEVEKSLSKGKIGTEEFLDVVGTAMMEGTNGVKKIAGAAKEAGSSWGNTFTNMKAAVTRGTEDIIMNVDKMLTSNGLPDMRSLVTLFGEKFEGVLKSVSDYIPTVTGYLMGMYESSKPGLNWIAETAMPAIRDGIGFAVDKGREMYDFFVVNWPLIAPVVAGVAASIAAFKVGIVAITAAKTTWGVVTSAVQIATMLLNGTLALSPFGWVVIAIGAVVAAGIALWMNWDVVKEKAMQLWEKVKEVFGGIYEWGQTKIAGVTGFFSSLHDKFTDFKNAITNFTPPEWISKIGSSIGSAAGKVGNFISGSHASGLDRVPYDGYVAELHKDEMVVPATQSRNLRQRGLNINNIDKGGPAKSKVSRKRSSSVKSNSINIAKLADQIIVREEADIDKIATMLVRKLEEVHFNMA